MKNIEDYMNEHDFVPADKAKVRKFLKEKQAVQALITKNDIRWIDKNGYVGVTGRGNIGIQDNFR